MMVIDRNNDNNNKRIDCEQDKGDEETRRNGKREEGEEGSQAGGQTHTHR